MLISVKVKKAIEADIKAQTAYLKGVEAQEKTFEIDLTSEKERIKSIIGFCEKVLKDAA